MFYSYGNLNLLTTKLLNTSPPMYLRLENLSEQRQHMQLALKRSIKDTLTAEQRAQQLEEMLAQEDYNVVQLKRMLDQLGDKQFSSSQDCYELKTKAKTMASELEGGKAAARNLGSKQHKLDQELLKQQQILYTQDFQVQQLQHKLARLEGERSGEELDHLTALIKVNNNNLTNITVTVTLNNYFYLYNVLLHCFGIYGPRMTNPT